MGRTTKVSWTEEDLTLLRSMAAKGASAVRIAAALNRTVNAVKAEASRKTIVLAKANRPSRSERAAGSGEPRMRPFGKRED